MPVIPNDVDWSATAAWIALAISIIGTIASPLITTWLTNKHQLKMYKLKSEANRIDKINDARTAALNAFISNTGKCISVTSLDNISDFGSSYFAAYQYVPEEYWSELDSLFNDIVQNQWDDARKTYVKLIHLIADLLKEPLR